MGLITSETVDLIESKTIVSFFSPPSIVVVYCGIYETKCVVKTGVGSPV